MSKTGMYSHERPVVSGAIIEYTKVFSSFEEAAREAKALSFSLNASWLPDTEKDFDALHLVEGWGDQDPVSLVANDPGAILATSWGNDPSFGHGRERIAGIEVLARWYVTSTGKAQFAHADSGLTAVRLETARPATSSGRAAFTAAGWTVDVIVDAVETTAEPVVDAEDNGSRQAGAPVGDYDEPMPDWERKLLGLPREKETL